MDQLFKYTQIEQDIGFGLDTLFKALKNGIYVKIEDYPVSYSEKGEPMKGGVYFVPGKYLFYSSYFDGSVNCLSTEYFNPALTILPVKTYGKKWALTQEELSQPSPKKVSRLTKKEVEDCATSVVAANISRTCGKTLTNRILLELLEYKSIEEQLGIDLVTFFKFLNAKVCYEKDPDDNEITKCLITGITKTGILNVQEAFPYGECEREAKFTDYGKTWALTREELEHELERVEIG